MKKVIILLALLALSVGNFSCGGQGSGSADIPPGENPGVASVVRLLPSQFVAQTNASITLHAKVLDGNGVPLPNVPVTFTNLSEPFGIISSVLKSLGIIKPKIIFSATVKNTNTDSNGIATVSIRSTTSGFATIQAEVNNGVGILRDKKTVFFSTFSLVFPGPPAPFLILDVDSDPTFATPDEPSDFILFKNAGDNTRTIRATVFNANGVPVSGSIVTFGSDSTDVTFANGANQIAVITDGNGRASVLATVNPSALSQVVKTINITASADNGAANVLTLFLEPVVIDTSASSLSASPTTITVGGTSAITATVKINTGDFAPDGTAVNFTATCGTVDAFAQTAGGVALATFTAPSIPGTCTVTGRVGGTTIGTAAITVNRTLTVIPTTQTISNPAVGSTAAYTILGGTSPYIAFSSRPGLATVSVTGSTLTATVAGVPTANTTVTITIYDSAGDSVTASLVLDVLPPLPLTVIPTTQTISNPIVGNTAAYTILGGTAPYTAFSDSPAMATAAVAGSVVTATVAGIPTTDTTVKITIYDSVGTNVSASLILDVPPTLPLAVIPTAQTISNPIAGNVAAYTIVGGTAPYTPFSNNPALATVSVAGSVVTATVAGVPTDDTTVTITIYDSVGDSVTASLILDVVPTAALTVTPASITVTGTSDATDNVTFYISGGSGTYTGVFSNNTDVILNPTIIGNHFTIDPKVVATSTPVTLTVVDSLGATKTASVTVTPATSAMALNPSSITVDPTAGPITFNIIGGVSTFDVFTSDIAVVTVGGLPKINNLATNTFNAQIVGAGSATITVVDSDAKTVTATVTVTAPTVPPTPPTPDFTLSCNPATLTISASSSGFTVCRITSVNSYSAPVTLACLGLPGASTCTFNPLSPVTPPAGLSIDVIVTVNVGAVASNTYPFVLQGSDGGATHTVPLTLIVP